MTSTPTRPPTLRPREAGASPAVNLPSSAPLSSSTSAAPGLSSYHQPPPPRSGSSASPNRPQYAATPTSSSSAPGGATRGFFKAAPPPSLPSSASSNAIQVPPQYSRAASLGTPLRPSGHASSNAPLTPATPATQTAKAVSLPMSAPHSQPAAISPPNQLTPSRAGGHHLRALNTHAPYASSAAVAPLPTTPSSAHSELGPDSVRARKTLIHSTTTISQSTSITEQDAAPLSYTLPVNGKAEEYSSHSQQAAYVAETPKERLASEPWARKRHTAHSSIEDGSAYTRESSGSREAIRERVLAHQPASSLWWRLKERSRRLVSPFARLLGYRDLDAKKNDEPDVGYSSASRKTNKLTPNNGKKAAGRPAGRANWLTRLLQLTLLLCALLLSVYWLGPFVDLPLASLPLYATVAAWFAPPPPPPIVIPSGTPFTIISLLHDMNDAYLAEHRNGYLFQFNAVRSWLRLQPPSNILIYMDTQESCDRLTAMHPSFAQLRCQPAPCVNTQFNRPRLDCIFNHANEHSTTDIIAFVNGDIVLSPYLTSVLDSVQRQYDQHFSMVSRRTDTLIDDATLDQWFSSIGDGATDHTDAVIEYSRRNGTMHSEWGIDLFVYTRTLFATLDFPPFLAGVYRWDNWLLSTLILHDDMRVVDASAPQLVIHQQSGDAQPKHPDRPGHEWNDEIVKARVGSLYKIGHINNANSIVKGVCPDCTFEANPRISLHVHLAKYQHAQKWLSIIPVSIANEADAYTAHCYYKKLGLKHYFFLAKDDAIFDKLRAVQAPVVHMLHVPDVKPITAAKSAQGLLALQEHEFLDKVLKLNYHFLLVDVMSLVLTDPLDHLAALDYDVALKRAMSGAVVVSQKEYSSLIYAVRSGTQGQHYWKQVEDCLVLNDAMPDQRVWLDCITQQYTKIGGLLKKGFLDPFLFPDIGLALVDRWPQLNGYYPLVLVTNRTLNAQPEQRRELLKSWKLHASRSDDPSQCYFVHPPLFSPPTRSNQSEFTLKIRVLTFDRYASLQRLLTSLNEADYGGDGAITLEIAIDSPANASNLAVVEKNQLTIDTAKAFVWQHGAGSVIHQESHKGLVGQWTTGWHPESNTEILLVLEDDTAVSPHYYTWLKKMVQTYYLDPAQYDPRMYGFALQLQHTILGETLKERYGSRRVGDLVGNDTALFRYQLVGTWGGVFFPQHWREFVTWLREKQFQPATGTSNLLPPPFNPWVPSVPGNDWWANKTHKVWSQWYIRFAYEKGWYNVYTNFPSDPALSGASFDSNRTSLVGNFREAGDNFNHTKGMMNPIVHTLTADMMRMPPLSQLPLFDFHFNRVHDPAMLSLRNAIQNEQFIPQCWTMKEFIAVKKAKEAAALVAEDKRKLKEENKRRQQLGLKPLASLAQLNPPPPKPAAPAAAAAAAIKKSSPLANANKAATLVKPAPAAPVAAPAPLAGDIVMSKINEAAPVVAAQEVAPVAAEEADPAAVPA